MYFQGRARYHGWLLIHPLPQVPELVHDLLARLVILLLLGFELLLLRALHVGVALEDDEVPLLLLLLLVPPLALPLIRVLRFTLSLHALLLPLLVLFVLELLKVGAGGVSPGGFGPARNVFALLGHPSELILYLAEHLYPVGLVLMRDAEHTFQDGFYEPLQLSDLVGCALRVLLQEEEGGFDIDGRGDWLVGRGLLGGLLGPACRRRLDLHIRLQEVLLVQHGLPRVLKDLNVLLDLKYLLLAILDVLLDLPLLLL